MYISNDPERHQKLTLVLMIIIILFVGFIYWLNNKTPNVLNYPAMNRTNVVAFGDSLVEGFGSIDGGFVTDLELLIDYPIENLGVSGDTTLDGLNRIDEVLRRDPRLVIISLGGNDFLRRVPEEQVEKNLDKIISQIQNTGSMVMLLDVPGYGGLHKELADRHRTAYVSNILRGLIGRDTYMADAIHPNDVGYQKIADRIASDVAELLPLN